MAARTWVLATLLATAALAGCTNTPQAEDPAPDAAPDTAPPPPPALPDQGEVSDEPRGGEPGGAVTPRPQDFELSESGNIQGPFEHAWDMDLESPIYRGARIVFILDGLQPGTPPTARVDLALLDPHGTPLRTGTVGVGAPANILDWTFAPGELPLPGAYQLVASPGSQTSAPSVGFATYGVHITIDY